MDITWIYTVKNRRIVDPQQIQELKSTVRQCWVICYQMSSLAPVKILCVIFQART